MGRLLASFPSADVPRDSTKDTKASVSMFAMATCHFFLLPLLCDNPAPLELHSPIQSPPQRQQCLRKVRCLFSSLGLWRSAFPQLLTLTFVTVLFYSFWTLATWTDLQECIRKGTGMVCLFLQSFRRDFGILTRSSADTFFIAASI